MAAVYAGSPDPFPGEMARDLVEAPQHGDREAFIDLGRVRTDRHFAIAHRILRDVDRAVDALQDALVIAFRDRRGLRRDAASFAAHTAAAMSVVDSFRFGLTQ
jgi:hypothetical protein